MENPTETEEKFPIHVFLDKTLMGEVQDFQFRHGFNTRTGTIKALLRLGLKHDEDLTKEGHPLAKAPGIARSSEMAAARELTKVMIWTVERIKNAKVRDV